jgi:hypothetical protein
MLFRVSSIPDPDGNVNTFIETPQEGCDIFLIRSVAFATVLLVMEE